VEKRKMCCFQCDAEVTVYRFDGHDGLQWHRVPAGCAVSNVYVKTPTSLTSVGLVLCEPCVTRLEKGGMPS
jgi:hypothetical protein